MRPVCQCYANRVHQETSAHLRGMASEEYVRRGKSGLLRSFCAELCDAPNPDCGGPEKRLTGSFPLTATHFRCEPRRAFIPASMEERDNRETRLARLRFLISAALAAIVLTLAVLAALTWRHHSSSRLEHPATAVQQTDPTTGR